MRAAWMALFLSGAVVAAPDIAMGQESGWFLGVGGGQVELKEMSITGFKATDTGYKIFAGYQVNPYLGFDLAYIDGGEPSDSGPFAAAEMDVSAFQASLVGTVPIGEQFSFLARAGALRWDADITGVIFDQFGPIIFADSQSGTDFLWGLGAQIHVGPVTIRAEYEQADVEDTDYSFISGSLIYRF